MIRLLVSVFVCLTVAMSCRVEAQQQAAATPAVDEAKALLQAGQTAEARTLLETFLRSEPRRVDALFLLGMIALGDGNYRLAIARFHSALVYAPRATRIRLELGRAYYLTRDYDNAFRQFQFARAGNPPPGVIAAINQYLAAIRLEKKTSYDFSISVAPDSNINDATSAREADLFGVPFQLDRSSRRTSGLGISAEGGIEISPKLGKNLRLRLGALGERKDYQGRRFDDSVAALFVGPRLITGKWDLSLLGTAFSRWYGGTRLNQGAGVRAEANWYPDAKTAALFRASAEQIWYPHSDAQQGHLLTFSVGGVRALGPASNVTGRLAVSRQEARGGEFADWAAISSIGYYRDLPKGFSVYVEPSVGLARYDAADPFFAVRRRDKIAQVQLSILNRRIVMSRFTPRVTYTFTRRFSNLELYSFTQNRLEVGFTSSF